MIASFFLILFGLLNLFGLSQSLFFRQLMFVVIGIGVYFGMKTIGRHFFRLNAQLLYWLMAAILVITFIIGIEVKGSRRWLDFYFFNFQVSELFKVFLILFLTQLLTSKKILENQLAFFTKTFLYFAVPAFIIFKQPDLGNAAVFVFIYLMMILFSEGARRHALYLFFMSALVVPIGWFLLKGYQKARLFSFFSPHLDTQGISYNMIQAVITIGSGKFFGKGLGLSTQSRLYFLPENTTDFAFASLVEQFGFLGGFVVIVFYGIVIYTIAKRAIKFYNSTDRENQAKFLYCIGFLSYLVFQIFVNIGMNMGLLPIAGIALPFISYGGSAVLATLIGFALLP